MHFLQSGTTSVLHNSHRQSLQLHASWFLISLVFRRFAVSLECQSVNCMQHLADWLASQEPHTMYSYEADHVVAFL